MHCEKANAYEEPTFLGGLTRVQSTNIILLVVLTFAAFILVTMILLAELQSNLSLLQDYGSDPSPIGHCTAV